MTGYDRDGIDRVHANLASNTGQAEHASWPTAVQTYAELVERARTAGAYPVFEAPPELPDINPT